MNINAKIALDKQKHPERFCPYPRCLWRTAKLDHATQTYSGGGYCPRHKSKTSASCLHELAEVFASAFEEQRSR